MLLGMELFVDLEVPTEILDDLLGQIGVNLMLASAKEELQLLACQRSFRHDAGGGGRFAETVAPCSGSTLELQSGFDILVVEVEQLAEHGVCLVVGGTQAEAGFLDVVDGEVGDVVAEHLDEVGCAAEAEVIAEGRVVVHVGEE